MDVGQIGRALQALTTAPEAGAREEAQAFLLAVQRADLGLPAIAAWLAAPDAAVQLFAAQTIQVRTAKDFALLGADAQAAWKDGLVGLFGGVAAGAVPLAAAARHKVYQAVAVLMVVARAAWPAALDEMVAGLRGSAAAGDPEPYLEVLAVLPDETERLALKPGERYEWLHTLKGGYAGLAAALALVPLAAGPAPRARAKLRCLRAWVRTGLPVRLCGDAVDGAVALLQAADGGLLEPAADLLVEVAGLPGLDRAQTMALVPVLLGLRPLLAGPDEEAAGAVARLYVAFAEAHNDDVFNGLLGGSEDARAFLAAFLGLTGCPGSFLVDETVSDSTLNAWLMLHDLAIDAGLPASPPVAELFAELARCVLRKATLPAAGAWAALPDDLRAAHEQYRLDLADCLLYCWRVLGRALYPVLTAGLAPGADWRFIEARLYAFGAIAEEVEEYDETIGGLLAGLPALAGHAANRRHAVRLFGCFAHHRVLGAETVDLLLGEVRAGAATALEAARSLHRMQEEAPDVLQPRWADLLAALSLAAEASVLALLCRTVGAAVADAPREQRLARLGAAIGVLYVEDPGDARLAHLATLVQAAGMGAAAYTPAELAACPALAALYGLAAAHIGRAHAPATQLALCRLLEALVIGGGAGTLPLALPALEAVLRAPPAAAHLEMLASAVCVYGAAHPDLVRHAVGAVLQHAPRLDEEQWEALLGLLGKAAARGMAGLVLVDLQPAFRWTAQRLLAPAVSTALLKAIVRFHVSFLAVPVGGAHAPWLEAVYAEAGPAVLRAVLWAAANCMARSQLEPAGRLLFELGARFPAAARAWLQHALAADGFPAARYGAPEKAAFLRAMAACRSVGKAKQVFLDFIK